MRPVQFSLIAVFAYFIHGILAFIHRSYQYLWQLNTKVVHTDFKDLYYKLIGRTLFLSMDYIWIIYAIGSIKKTPVEA